MVASTHWLASAAGMATLEAGGNAFDAAVAAGLTLQVVEPHLNGPGGEGPLPSARRPGGPPRRGAPGRPPGPGRTPRRRHDRGLPPTGPRPGPRHRSAR